MTLGGEESSWLGIGWGWGANQKTWGSTLASAPTSLCGLGQVILSAAWSIKQAT